MEEIHQKTKKVAAYCRVSTDKRDQVNSLVSQKRYFSEYICRNPAWRLTKIYADEGVTGTSTKKRKAFNAMMADAENGLFDMIITKEISRFARNTLDSLYYTRKLKSMNIGIYFLNDNIFTLDPDSELRLAIMSSIAQEESRKTSDRVKWGQKRSMESGVAFGNSIYGYHLHKGRLSINPAEAAIVKQIFYAYIEGKGIHTIRKTLEAEGCTSPTGNLTWHDSTIHRILKNEKYCGDLLCNKTVTLNYLDHTSVKNKGGKNQIYIPNHHEPIIPRDVFEEAQQLRKARSSKKNTENPYKYTNKHLFSGKIKCAGCGASYTKRSLKQRSGAIREEWICISKNRYGVKKTNASGNLAGCNSSSITEDRLRTLMLSMQKEAITNQEEIKKNVLDTIQKGLDASDKTAFGSNTAPSTIQDHINKIKKKKDAALDAFLEGVFSEEELQRIKETYDTQLARLTQKINESKIKALLPPDKNQQMNEIRHRIDSVLEGNAFSEALCREILDKIIVRNHSEVEIHLNMVPTVFYRTLT